MNVSADLTRIGIFFLSLKTQAFYKKLRLTITLAIFCRLLTANLITLFLIQLNCGNSSSNPGKELLQQLVRYVNNTFLLMASRKTLAYQKYVN